MTTQITVADQRLVVLEKARPGGRDPVTAFVQSKKVGESRRSAAAAIRRVAGLIFARGDGTPWPPGQPGDDFVASIPWEQLTPADAAIIRTAITDSGIAASTANKLLANLRGVIQTAWRLGLMDADTRDRVKETLKRVPNRVIKSGRYVSQGEMVGLFRACGEDPTGAGARDAAIIALLYDLRRSEVANLEMKDYSPETTPGVGELLIRNAKHNATRMLKVANGQKDAIDNWLKVRGVADGRMFLPVTRGGRVLHEKKSRTDDEIEPGFITDQAIFYMLKRRAEEAGIRNLTTPHDLRRTGITDTITTHGLREAQQRAGHMSPTTTAGYDRQEDERATKVALGTHVPFDNRAGCHAKLEEEPLPGEEDVWE